MSYYYTVGAAVSFVLLLMGAIALFIGYANYYNSRRSTASRMMFYCCACVFIWDAGYGIMGICFNSDAAYIPRAMALLAVYLYCQLMVMYVVELGKIKRPSTHIALCFGMLSYLISWFQIIQKDAVTFEMTPWGYWYYSKMSWGRILQFASALYVLIFFYVELFRWKKRVKLAREKNIVNRFIWFGPVIVAGYIADTLIPSFFHTQAVPGSAIGAFVSVVLLLGISRRNMAFGATVTNVAEYVFREVNTPVIVLNYLDEVVLFNEIARDMFGFDYSKNSVITLDGRIIEDNTYTDEEDI